MTADLRKANPAPGKAQPGSVRPNGPPASDEADGRDDDVAQKSIAELSRRLAERAARQQAVDPAVAKAAHRAALKAYDRTRVRRQRLVLGFAVGAIACSAVAYLVATVVTGAVPLSPSAAALPEPASLLSMAAATPTPAPPGPASQAGDDLAQVRQALQQERDKSEKLARELRSQAATAANKNAVRSQELNELQRALQQEHDKTEQLARELAAARRGLRSQATAMADNAAHDQQLAELRQALQQGEASAAVYQEMLAQERARNQDLQQQLAARGDASPDRGRNATASLSEYT